MTALLLDTHIFIDYINGEKNLTKSLCAALDKAVQNHSFYLAAISLWEIAMLEMKKRIILSMPCVEWITQAFELTQTQIISLTPAIAVESCYLPGAFHEDPADRLIVASARVERLTLVTRDERILAYGAQKYVSLLKA